MESIKGALGSCPQHLHWGTSVDTALSVLCVRDQWERGKGEGEEGVQGRDQEFLSIWEKVNFPAT